MDALLEVQGTTMAGVIIEIIWGNRGLYRDNGRENGNYYLEFRVVYRPHLIFHVLLPI